MTKSKAIAAAAASIDIETLETRGNDDLDFHDISVAGLKAALEAAYNAGMKHQARYGAFADRANELAAEAEAKRCGLCSANLPCHQSHCPHA